MQAKQQKVTLFRGINKSIKHQYKKGSNVVWWSISSCTPKKSVASTFSGSSGTIFEVKAKTAISIRQLSAYPDEEEYVLAPGTLLKVVNVSGNKVTLEELPEERKVC